MRVRVDDLGDGLHRVRFGLPWSGLDHVYCYALAGSPGWTLVDAGLGVTAAANSWRDALDQLGRPPVAQVVITHYHVDHAGAGADLRQLTGCDVVQTATDAVQARSWHDPQAADHQRRHLARHGCPVDVVEAIAEAMRDLARHVHIAPATRLVTDGDLILGAGEAWRVLALPGHADGQIGLWANRSGRLLSADAILTGVAPYIGMHAISRPDPLADQFATLERLSRLAPRACHPSHHDAIGDVAARAEQLRTHHEHLLEGHRAALRAGPQHAYGVSLRVYGQTMGAVGRRIAVVEALAHLTHMERRGQAESETGADGRVRFRLVTSS